jgi:DNA-binding response OmpR family regulator
MKKILLIEDDADLFSLLKYNLEREGYVLVGSQTGKGAVELCRREKPDLLILDIMLPDSDGLEICRAVRAHPELSHIPILFLTAKATETDRIVGLELGADDYIVKPFFVRELVARIKVHLRDRTVSPKVLKAGALELNSTTCTVRLKEEPVSLTATEFKLLEFLMSHPGAVFSRDQLLDAVWGHGRAVTARTVDVYILRLRQKLEDDPANPAFLHSSRGFGYSFSSGIHQTVTDL